MKRLFRNVNATSNSHMNSLMFTFENVVDPFSQIEELKGCKITVNEDSNGLSFAVGDYTYSCEGNIK